MKTKTSWRAKLEKEQEAVVKEAPPNWAAKYGGDQMLIATPMIIDGLIRQIPGGRLATVKIIREVLAHQYQADFTCPLTTGIFIRIAAEAAEEDRAKGKSTITPYWRVIKDDGTLNPKFPGGMEQQAKLLSDEGFTIIRKGKHKLQVKDFEEWLVEQNIFQNG